MSEARKLGHFDPAFTGLINKVSDIVQRISGNRLGDKQSFMIETRVKKRMMELGLKTPADYETYLKTLGINENVIEKVLNILEIIVNKINLFIGDLMRLISSIKFQ